MSEPVVYLPLLEARAIAGGRRDGDRLASDAHRFSWQREMEKAEAQAWFKVEKPSDATSTSSPSTGRDATPPIETSSSFPKARQTSAGEAPARNDGAKTASAARAGGVDVEAARSAAQTRSPGYTNQSTDGSLSERPALTDEGAMGAVVGSSASLGVLQPASSPLSTMARGADLGGATASGEVSALMEIGNASSDVTTVFVLPTASAERALAASLAIDVAPSAISIREPEALSPSGAVATDRLSAAVARALDPLAPVRLHVEWSAASAKVWIGLDSAADVHLPTLVVSLARWLDRAGAKLRSVTCNGEVCFSDGDLSPTSLTNGTDRSSNRARRLDRIHVDITLNQEK